MRRKIYAKLPRLLKQLNVKILMDIHLNPGHKVFMLFDAPNAEAVRDLLVMAGFSYFLDSEFYLVTPIGQLLKHIEDMPTIYRGAEPDVRGSSLATKDVVWKAVQKAKETKQQSI